VQILNSYFFQNLHEPIIYWKHAEYTFNRQKCLPVIQSRDWKVLCEV